MKTAYQIIVVLAIALYLMGVFVTGTFNSNDWSTGGKITICLIWSTASIIIAVLQSKILEDVKI